MRPHVGHVVHAGVGYLRPLQPLGHLLQRQLRKGVQDDALQVQAVVVALCVAAKAWIACQCGLGQHMLAKLHPLAFVLQAQHHGADVRTVGAQQTADLKWPIGVNGGVGCCVARWGWRAVHRVIHRKAHPLGQGFEHGHIDVRTFAGFFSLQQGRQNIAVGVHACGNVGNRVAAFAGLLGCAGHTQITGFALNQQVVGFFVAVRPIVAIA